MKTESIGMAQHGNFYLSKWFLDFTGENGEAMIFYAAILKWHGLVIPYTSWLNYDKLQGVKQKSRVHHVNNPAINDRLITWSDSKFGVSGTWEAKEETIHARIFDSEEGTLEWKCYQPASKVTLFIKNKQPAIGRGYAEQIIMTVPPWNIPMDQLRWGRFVSDEDNLVWIEIKENKKWQWIWLNGEKTDNCIIDDNRIFIPEREMVLNLDRGVILESEKKIFSIVEKLIQLIPGFNKVVPLQFLMADECKWLSKGALRTKANTVTNGMAIHELVQFKAPHS